MRIWLQESPAPAPSLRKVSTLLPILSFVVISLTLVEIARRRVPPKPFPGSSSAGGSAGGGGGGGLVEGNVGGFGSWGSSGSGLGSDGLEGHSYLIDWSSPRRKGSWYELWKGRRIAPGTKEWEDWYPGPESGPKPRSDWIRRYEYVKSLGLIPPVPVGRLEGGLSFYPEGLDMGPGPEGICSFRRSGCTGEGDIVRGRRGTWAINFDDGPLPPSGTLYRFLDSVNAKATHFMVGYHVKTYTTEALQALSRGDHLAVHTWSHSHMTTRSDHDILGELGWTMQIISDLSDGRTLPKYWRPPFGDVDDRVRAIATHVFNMTAVMWNWDSSDWSLNQTYARGDFIDPPYSWLTPPIASELMFERIHKPNLLPLTPEELSREEQEGEAGGVGVERREGVIALEHELSEESVGLFAGSFGELRKEGWEVGTVPDVIGRREGEGVDWYQRWWETAP